MTHVTSTLEDFAALAGLLVGLVAFLLGAAVLTSLGVDAGIAGVLAGGAGAAGMWGVGLAAALG